MDAKRCINSFVFYPLQIEKFVRKDHFGRKLTFDFDWVRRKTFQKHNQGLNFLEINLGLE